MSEYPSPSNPEDDGGGEASPGYEAAALATATPEYEYMDQGGGVSAAGEISYDRSMQEQASAAASDTGGDQYHLSGGMRQQPDVAIYGGASSAFGEPQPRQQQRDGFSEQPIGQEEQQGGEGEEEEDEYEDPEDMIREFGRHPMMDRVQEALYNQLLQTYERVSEELRDKDTDVKK